MSSDYDPQFLWMILASVPIATSPWHPVSSEKRGTKAVSFTTRTHLLFLVVVFDQERKARQKRFFQPLFLRKTFGQYGVLKAKEIKLEAQPLMASRHGYRWRASPTKAALHLYGPSLGLA